VLAPKAVATLDAHETQEERHQDNSNIQKKIVWLTAAIALLAVAQVSVNVWSELNPDPVVPGPAASNRTCVPDRTSQIRQPLSWLLVAPEKKEV
jgi:hypothetical protein